MSFKPMTDFLPLILSFLIFVLLLPSTSSFELKIGYMIPILIEPYDSPKLLAGNDIHLNSLNPTGNWSNVIPGKPLSLSFFLSFFLSFLKKKKFPLSLFLYLQTKTKTKTKTKIKTKTKNKRIDQHYFCNKRLFL